MVAREGIVIHRIKASGDRFRWNLSPPRLRFEEDIDAGTRSVLEHGYLTKVERPHRLPAGLRQVRHVGELGTQYRDLVLPGLVVVELDGRIHHSGAENRDRDLDRDLDAAAAGHASVRLGWGQVFGRPCASARRLALILARHGWTGSPLPCSEACAMHRG